MKVIYSDNEDPKYLSSPSIFLAGPSPRNEKDYDWRTDALKILEDYGFNGNVFYPWPQGDAETYYSQQIEWELKHIDRANVVLFWVPRDLEKLPAYTTNVEFGFCIKTKTVVYGRPNNAPKTRYLDHLYMKYCMRNPCETLEDTIKESIASSNFVIGKENLSKSE